MAREYSNGFPSCLIDMSFDMDEALTMPTNFSHQISESDSLIAEMPSVCCSEDACSVCMENFGSGSIGKRVPCGHVFHVSCISSWLSNCDSCPLCRFNISVAGRSRNS
ncbi:RING/U-box superfamily protein [Euphorbia peplus]|nr:RING/U-box superfamily protein [Euphorbia peplus]